MNKLIFIVLILCTVAILPARAVPTFQVYSPGATRGTVGDDEDTWFVTTSGPFDLVVVGAYQKNTVSLTQVTLVVSVPEGIAGAVTINGTVLSPIYDLKSEFLPKPVYDDEGNLVYDGASFNEHYPFKDGVSDFLTYDLGSFGRNGPVHNYTADVDEEVEWPVGDGEEKTYSVSFSGFDWVHFDVYGLVTFKSENDLPAEPQSQWRINPASHDTTAVPAPGAVLLGSLGVAVVGWLRRRRTL